MLRFYITISFLALMCFTVRAQSEADSTASTQPNNESNFTLDGSVSYHQLYPNPKRAGLFSAVLPGSGQFYNKQYWKIPVVYALLGTGVYFINFNSKNYRRYRQAYIARIDGDPNTRDEFENIYPSADAIKTGEDYYKKNLDLSVVLTTLGFTLQIIDAITYAYLKDFDVSSDL